MTMRRVGLVIAAAAIATTLYGAEAVAQQRANWWQRVAAPFLGCRPAEVQISEREEDNGVDSWIAACRGLTMTCVWVRGSSFHCGPLR